MSTQIGLIKGVSRAMLVAVPIIGAVTVLLYGLYWAGDVNVIWFGPNDAHNLVIFDDPPANGRKLTGIMATLPPTFAWLIALLFLFRLFHGFHRGGVFERKEARRMRFYSLFAGLAALLDIAGSGARRWAQGEFSDQPLWTHIQINAEHGLIIFTAAVFYFFSLVIEQGAIYKDESESYL